MAMRAFSGSLASVDLLEAIGREAGPRASLRAVLSSGLSRLGPASAARQVFDLLAAPLVIELGGSVSVTENTMDPSARPCRRGVPSC